MPQILEEAVELTTLTIFQEPVHQNLEDIVDQGQRVQNGDVDTANGGLEPPNTVVNSSLNTLIDVQSRFGVIDEVAKLVERVEKNVAKGSQRYCFRYCVDAPRRESSMSG